MTNVSDSPAVSEKRDMRGERREQTGRIGKREEREEIGESRERRKEWMEITLQSANSAFIPQRCEQCR